MKHACKSNSLKAHENTRKYSSLAIWDLKNKQKKQEAYLEIFLKIHILHANQNIFLFCYDEDKFKKKEN